MSNTSRLPIWVLDDALDQALSIDPIYLSTGERQDALVAVARLKAKTAALELRLLAASDDIAETTGARSTAAWLADQTRDAHGTVRRTAALAGALDTSWGEVGKALSAGRVNLAQARVMVEALDGLPLRRGVRPRAAAGTRPPRRSPARRNR